MLVPEGPRVFGSLDPEYCRKSRTGATSLGNRSLAPYEALVTVWRPVEERVRLPRSLSLVAHTERA